MRHGIVKHHADGRVGTHIGYHDRVSQVASRRDRIVEVRGRLGGRVIDHVPVVRVRGGLATPDQAGVGQEVGRGDACLAAVQVRVHQPAGGLPEQYP